MAQQHLFILTPGVWIGEGRITFSASPDELRFYTKWHVEKIENGKIACEQRVEMEGREDTLTNRFLLNEILPSRFHIQLSSEFLGPIHGKGLIDQTTIAWEFRGNADFEGFEVYQLLPTGEYRLHAEYASSDSFRTIVDGRIWLKKE